MELNIILLVQIECILNNGLRLNWFISSTYSAANNIVKDILFPMTFVKFYTIFGSFCPESTTAATSSATATFRNKTITGCKMYNWCYSSGHKHTQYWILAVGY